MSLLSSWQQSLDKNIKKPSYALQALLIIQVTDSVLHMASINELSWVN